MGYDITAYESAKTWENINSVTEIAYLRTYMGAFRMCREQGYDWFKYIDAIELDGGVSGRGDGKYITLTNLENAMFKLDNHDTKGRLASSYDDSGDRDEWTHRKPLLKDFMQKCIDWCMLNSKNEVFIYFG